MSKKLRVVPYAKMKAVAEAAGFTRRSGKGSHHVFGDAAGRTTGIPDHGSTDLFRPLIRKILRDMGMTVDEYHDWLDKV